MSTPANDSRPLPDLVEGVSSDSLPPSGMLVGKVGDASVLLVRTPEGLHAVQAHCPHYGAPLDEGCVHEGQIHCPWHHASFDLAGGTLDRPPALAPLQSWPVTERDGRIRVAESPLPPPSAPTPPRERGTVVVVGAGAGGTAAVLALREAGHRGPLLLVDPDPDAPYDRPNLSKDYLAGTAPEEWLPLRTDDDWAALDVERVVDALRSIRAEERVVELRGGREVEFDGLILATGAEPRRLPVPGADGPHVVTLRSLADCRSIRERATSGQRAVLIGAGFIGLEAAASLRNRGVEVAVVAPEAEPLTGVLGDVLGAELRRLHEAHGVRFHLERSVAAIEGDRVVLDDGSTVPADFVLVGIGVEPRLDLARAAGLEVDRGVLVNAYLESSREGIYAVGDIARFPDPRTGDRIRIEHWAVAEGQGRTAAFNLLGHARPYRDVPFFWTAHYDVTVQWTGFPGEWDHADARGSLDAGSMAVHFERDGRPQAAAFVGQEQEALAWELARADEIAAG